MSKIEIGELTNISDNELLKDSRFIQVVIPINDERDLEFATACRLDDFSRLVLDPAIIWKYLESALRMKE